MSLVSLLELQIRADRLDDAPAIVNDVLKATRAFDGNLGVDVTRDTKDDTHWILVERWESLEHDDAYRAWRATPEGASPLGELLSAPPVLTRLTVDGAI